MNTDFKGGKVVKTNFKTYMTTSSYPNLSNWYNDLVSIRMCSYSHCCKDDETPKEYYINEKKKTIVLKWNDNTITKVKVSKDDKFDARYGFLIAYFQRHCGMSKTKANKYLDNLEKEKEIK